MNSQDIIRLSSKAKSETEAFINLYINDRAKGWPKSCLCGSTFTGYQRERRIEEYSFPNALAAK